jgi:thiamine-monophosphate kinase
MKELAFIEIIKNTLSDSSFIGDDTAFVDGLAITQDTMIEDIHFRQATTTPYSLGQKAIVVNLSDLAAAGAKPLYILVSLSLPSDTTEDFVKEFYEGINKICQKYGAKVIGGDITGAQKIAITVTAIGKAQKHIKRSSAQVGDVICVTGEHGNSRAGLEILEKNLEANEKFEQAHKRPIPRIEEGLKIAEICDNPAIMDTSDGLADALYKIAQASDVTMDVDFKKIPYDKNLQALAKEKLQNWVLFGGEDYELLTCVRKGDFEKLKAHLELYPIGEVIPKADEPVIINFEQQSLKIDKKAIENMSFDHFTGEQK